MFLIDEENRAQKLLVFRALPIDWFEVRVTRSVNPEVRVNQKGKPVWYFRLGAIAGAQAHAFTPNQIAFLA